MGLYVEFAQKRTTFPSDEFAPNSNLLLSCPTNKTSKLDFDQTRFHDCVSFAVISLSIYQIKGQQPKATHCGKRLVDYEPLITNGFKSSEGEWPWHAAIYHIAVDQSVSYKCGATILNSNSILTAAHCVYENDQPIIPNRVLIHVGQHNLKVPGQNTRIFEAYEIIPHHSYNSSDLSNDIAVIRLATKVAFNDYLQPICLWDSKKVDVSEVIGRFGTVIGWGVTETDRLSSILRQAVMPVVPSFSCLVCDFFGSFLSDMNFCAGFANGTSVCNGDSGGGMTFEENGVYGIRGIVSLALSRQDKQICNSREYVIFTDVAKYLPWIEANINMADMVTPLKSVETGTIVPLYLYPATVNGVHSWQPLIDAHANQPIPIWAIVNANSGPGSMIDSNYVESINMLKRNGIHTLGYVSTNYTQKDIEQVKREVDTWRTFYATEGIFFNEMTNQNMAHQVNYYKQLNDYAKQQNFHYSVGNPGTDVHPIYVDTMDTIMIYGSSGSFPTFGQYCGFHVNYPKKKWGIFAYDLPSLTDIREKILASKNCIGFIYVTNDYGVNPWDSLPSYLTELFTLLKI